MGKGMGVGMGMGMGSVREKDLPFFEEDALTFIGHYLRKILDMHSVLINHTMSM